LTGEGEAGEGKTATYNPSKPRSQLCADTLLVPAAVPHAYGRMEYAIPGRVKFNGGCVETAAIASQTLQSSLNMSQRFIGRN